MYRSLINYFHVIVTVQSNPFTVRPTMSEMTALGVAMAAGLAEGVNAWHVEKGESNEDRMQRFTPKISSDGKSALLCVQFDVMLIGNLA